MYAVSNAYREAMKSPVQHFRLRGTIVNKNMTYNFTEKNILKGSFTISNQACGSSAMEIGSVYAGELNMTLLKGVVPRYSIYGAIVTPFLSLLTANGWEEIPLGVFIIGEANYSVSGCEITAYDKMTLFDKSLNLASAQETMWKLLDRASEECDVLIGMTEAEVRSLPNGDRVLGMYENNDMETWRDLISWLAQTAGCFATMDRFGRLVFRRYTTNVVDTIDASHRFMGGKFSDFVTRYTGISCVNIAEQTTSYYGAEDVEDDALTMNLGSNPFLQYGVDETVEEGRRRVLVALEVIRYVPFTASLIGNPAYDLGDVFRFTEGIADSSHLSCMTKYDWKYNDTFTMEGVGENPALANARSKIDKDISGLLSNTDENRMYYFTYTNPGNIRVKTGEEKPIINMTFATVKASKSEFKAEVLCEITTDKGKDNTIVEATYILNGNAIENYYPTETLTDGKHILHFFYPLMTNESTVNRWIVKLSATNGTVTIDDCQIMAMISGQGLAGGEEWDGTIEATEDVLFDLVSMRPRFESDVVITHQEKNPHGVSDSMQLNLTSLLGSIRDKMSDGGGVNIVVVEDRIDYEDNSKMSYNRRFVTLSENKFTLRKCYDYYSTEQSIDSGRLVVAELNTEAFQSTESVVVTNE